MKAVNLIPTEERRGTRSGGSGVGYASYVLLGVLALLVGGTYLYVSAGNTAKSRTAEVTKFKAAVAVEQANASALQPYVDFQTTAQARISTVTNIANGRFSWYLAMRDLSRVLPRNVWLTSFTGSVTPGVAFGDGGGGGGNTGPLRAQMPGNPAVELSGCTVSNDAVARLLSNLRLINGVVRVSLAAAEKSTGATPAKDTSVGASSSAASPSAAATAGSGTGGDCRNGSERFPQFALVVFFKALPASAATAATQTGSTPATPATGTPATTTPGTTTPGTTTPSTTTPGTTTPSTTAPSTANGQPAAGTTSSPTPGASAPTGSAPATTGASN